MAIFLGCIVYLPEALNVGINSSNMKNMVNFTNFGAYTGKENYAFQEIGRQY